MSGWFEPGDEGEPPPILMLALGVGGPLMVALLIFAMSLTGGRG